MQGCQCIVEHGQLWTCDECHIISYVLVNINTDAFSWEQLLFQGHQCSDKVRQHIKYDVLKFPVRDVPLSAFPTGTKEKQTSSESKVGNRSCGLSSHQGSGGFILVIPTQRRRTCHQSIKSEKVNIPEFAFHGDIHIFRKKNGDLWWASVRRVWLLLVALFFFRSCRNESKQWKAHSNSLKRTQHPGISSLGWNTVQRGNWWSAKQKWGLLLWDTGGKCKAEMKYLMLFQE